MSTLLICNVQIVNEGLIQEADVFIRDGRIAQIGSDLSHLPAKQFIDGAGKHLMPGIIDTQSKLNAPVDFSASLNQESRAAIAGGITSSLLLPNYSSESTYLKEDLLSDKLQLQNNLSVYYPASNTNLDDIASIDPSRYCGLYVDMASTKDDLRIDDPETLDRIFKESPILVAIHAEDAPSILESEESYRQIYADEIPFHLHGSIRSAEACYIAAAEVLNIALKNEARAHLLHVSSDKEIELLETIRQKSSMISADVCSHYLTFSDADYADKGSLLKCEPSIKTDIDRAALIQGLLDDNINNICSGHTPLVMSEKQAGYFDVPSGLPLAQYTLPSILEHYQDQILSLELIAQKTGHAVADCFAIQDRGYIREGYWADLVLIDLEGSFIARDEDVVSAAAWTIFNGNEFRSSVVTTIINGQIVWSAGEFQEIEAAGKPLQFTRSG